MHLIVCCVSIVHVYFLQYLYIKSPAVATKDDCLYAFPTMNSTVILLVAPCNDQVIGDCNDIPTTEIKVCDGFNDSKFKKVHSLTWILNAVYFFQMKLS